MTNPRPSFEKEELAFSSTPYVYLPVNIPAFTVELSHREAIDGELLQRALDRTIRRMPYLSDTLVSDHGAVYYAKNPLPMEAAHFAGVRPIGGSETNYHLLDLTWDGSKTWFSMYHGFCDGQGISTFLESVLYHYYCMKDNTVYEANGIREDSTQMSAAETFDPCSVSYEVSPDFTMPETKPQAAPYHLPEAKRSDDGTVLEYGLRVPSGDLMRVVKANGTSPSILLSLLVSEAIRRVHPEADAPIQVNIPVSIRRQLGCEETFKNCSSRAVLPVGGTPMDALPFAERAARLRALLKQQISPDLFRSIYNKLGPMYRGRMQQAASFQEELKKPDSFSNCCHDTFYIDYIGSLHKTGYSEQITDVRFLCEPAAGKTVHLNVIEHNGVFRIACLSGADASALAAAIEQVMREHELPVQSLPAQSFQLVHTVWRESQEQGA